MVRDIARKHEVCPYYLTQELVRWADVVVADYNYMRISAHRGRSFQAIVDGVSEERGRHFRLIVDDVSA